MRKMIEKGHKKGHLFQLNMKAQPSSLLYLSVSPSLASANKTWDLWHRRLGHPHTIRLEHMSKSGLLLKKMNVKSISFDHKCQSCALEIASKLSFSSSNTKVDEPFDLIYSDLWGPSPILSRLGYRYFVLFINQYTQFAWVYFLCAKSELTNIAKIFITMIRT